MRPKPGGGNPLGGGRRGEKMHFRSGDENAFGRRERE